jgi:hypothetical protein
MVELKRVLLIWGMALAAWAQPEPLPTPTEPAAPVVVPVAQPRVVSHPRFLVARGETLRFPSSATTAPPPNDYCRFEKKAGGWFVTGVAPGVASFNWGKDHWDILVRERALLLPSSLPLTVFGDYPVGQALLHYARDYLHGRADLKESGGVLKASGADLIAYEGAPKVELRTEVVEARKADGLILSNWPEKIEEDQVLLEAPLTPEKHWRVMVHHRNLPEQPPRWLEIEIVQPAGVDERYAVTSYLTGPASDEIFCGHLAAARYFKAPSSGYLVSVGGGKRHLLERALLKPGQTVSAMLAVRGLLPRGQAGLLRISVRGLDSAEPLTLKPWDGKARTARGVFPAEVVRELSYQVGSAYLFEDIGGQPYLSEVSNGSPSPGNFGAVYRYRWKLENATDQPQEVRMEMSARGGPARASLWIDGEGIETDLLKAEPRLLRRWLLPPASRREVMMETFPQAGSNFPLSVTLSSRPAANTPETPIPQVLPSYYIP